jgi:hypothetical protein
LCDPGKFFLKNLTEAFLVWADIDRAVTDIAPSRNAVFGINRRVWGFPFPEQRIGL